MGTCFGGLHDGGFCTRGGGTTYAHHAMMVDMLTMGVKMQRLDPGGGCEEPAQPSAEGNGSSRTPLILFMLGLIAVLAVLAFAMTRSRPVAGGGGRASLPHAAEPGSVELLTHGNEM
eukprot:NODE_5776_length_556_cov_221.622754.p1 GENE.NODE_5776_length_556_cov_221.622754~~NODE_5776_length_556_cov_221.622754.p1  ORF type:complete len:117 (-),score=27.76 NODE_5776_length_556_cov_221.622754:188-538(-)